MILLFGGTTEGLLIQQFFEQQKLVYVYSTKSKTQLNQLEAKHGCIRHGSLDLQKMLGLCKQHKIKIIIDAAHPFATDLHKNIQALAQQTALPLIHYDRTTLPKTQASNCHYINSYAECISKIINSQNQTSLVLSGISSIEPLKTLWQQHPVYFKILPRTGSMQKALGLGLPEERIWVEQANIQPATLWQWVQAKHIQHLIFKESGWIQAYKMDLVKNKPIQAYILKRPAYPKPKLGLQYTQLYSIKQLEACLLQH